MFKKFVAELKKNGYADMKMLIDYSNYRSFLSQYQSEKLKLLLEFGHTIEGTFIKAEGVTIPQHLLMNSGDHKQNVDNDYPTDAEQGRHAGHSEETLRDIIEELKTKNEELETKSKEFETKNKELRARLEKLEKLEKLEATDGINGTETKKSKKVKMPSSIGYEDIAKTTIKEFELTVEEIVGAKMKLEIENKNMRNSLAKTKKEAIDVLKKEYQSYIAKLTYAKEDIRKHREILKELAEKYEFDFNDYWFESQIELMILDTEDEDLNIVTEANKKVDAATADLIDKI